MLAKRFERADIILFAAGPTAVEDPAVLTDLQERLQEQKAATVHIISLASKIEVGSGLLSAFESAFRSLGVDSNGQAALPPTKHGVYLIQPSHESIELWQQSEHILEQLQDQLCPLAAATSSQTSSSDLGAVDDVDMPEQPDHRPAASSSSNAAPLPMKHGLATAGQRGRISCRDNSLDRFLHLSSSGMLRRWLPTYSTLAQKALRAGQEGTQVTFSAMAEPTECFIQGNTLRSAFTKIMFCFLKKTMYAMYQLIY